MPSQMAAADLCGAAASPVVKHRRRVVISSKHATPELPVYSATPELPLLEGAAFELSTLDEWGLLPAAAIDQGDFFDTWTPTTAVPASREEQSEEEEGLEEHELDNPTMPFVPANSAYEQVWCSVRLARDGHVMVLPVAEGSAQILPSDRSLIKLWSWVQDDGQGGRLVLPSTERVGEGPSLQEVAAPLLASQAQEPSCCIGSGPTTLRVADLPEEITQDDFLEILDREEASGLYNFVFLSSSTILPFGPRRAAVVNCISAACAQSLAEKLSARTFWGAGSRRSCEVSWFGVQGIGGLVEYFQGYSQQSGEDDVQPLLFADGWPGKMPNSPLYG